jgi:hypothetical protein
MKRIIFIIVISLSISVMLKAQMNSGSKFIAGSNQLSFSVHNQKYLGTTSDPTKYFNFDLNTKAGYFLKNRIAIGGLVDYGFQKSSQSSYSKNYITGFSIGPLARYYVQYGTLIPFAEASVVFGIQNNKTIYEALPTTEFKHSVLGFKAGIGANYFLNESIAFEGMLDYYMTKLKPKWEGATGDGELESGVELSVGIIFYFGTI